MEREFWVENQWGGFCNSKVMRDKLWLVRVKYAEFVFHPKCCEDVWLTFYRAVFEHEKKSEVRTPLL